MAVRNAIGKSLGLVLVAAGLMLAPESNSAEVNTTAVSFDNRVAVRTSLGLRSAMPLSAQTVELVFGLSVTDTAKIPGGYRIISYDDSNYAYEKFVVPLAATMLKEPEVDAVEDTKFDFSKAIVVLKLPFPMRNNCKYYIVAQGFKDMITGAHTAASFTYSDSQKYSRADNAQDLVILGLRELEPVGNGILKLQFGPNFSTTQGSKIENYTVSINGSPVKVVNFGRISKVDAYVPAGWPFAAIPVHDLYLKLATPYKDGDLIEVKVAPAVTKANNAATLKFDSDKSISYSIKVNQVGYLTDSPVKVAYLGRWLGSFPEMKSNNAEGSSAGTESAFWAAAVGNESEKKTDKPIDKPVEKIPGAVRSASASSPALSFDSPPEFSIVNEKDGKVVFTGKSSLIHLSGELNEGVYKVDHSAENVYELLFSEFKMPGRYYIKIAGVGRSLPFEISDTVYSKAFTVQAAGVMAQRCGIELKPPYSEWRRIACHNNGLVLTSQIAWQKHNISEDFFGKIIKTAATKSITPELQKLNSDPALKAWFKLDGDFSDSSGNNMNLEALSDKPSFTADNTMFPGNKVYGPTIPGERNGAINKNLKLNALEAATVCGWFKKDPNNDFHAKLFGFGEIKYGSPKLGVSSIWGVIEATAGANTRMSRFERINNNKWHHLALTIGPRVEGGSREFYLFCDGKKVATGTANDDKIDGQPFGLGTISGAGAAGGFFDDIRVYSRALTQEEVKELATPRPSDVPVVIKGSGGHHDAGDYNPRCHIDVAQTLMSAYEMAPGKFYDDQLSVPESSNGLPDILDEAFWSIKIWLDLQDQDGGVRNGTESAGDPYFGQTVELDNNGDYAYAKDVQGSYIFAGTLAQAARLWKMNDRTKESEDFLNRARRAYEWAEKNQPRFADPGMFAKVLLDPKTYAAAELFKTTGEDKFNNDYLACSIFSKNKDAAIDKYQVYDQSRASWAYATATAPSANKAIQEAAKKAIIKRADEYIKLSATMAYKFYRHPWAPINWGTGTYENFLDPVIWSWKLTGDDKYREWIVRSCDNTLGANPLSLCFITGLGSRGVHAPLHNSRYGHIGEVAIGMQVQGPNQKPEGYRVPETAYPKVQENMGSLQNFVDCHFAIVMDEGLVRSQAQTMAVFGMLLPDKQTDNRKK